jgi:RNA-directed DNA polymerase
VKTPGLTLYSPGPRANPVSAFHRGLASVIVHGPWTELAITARCRTALPVRMNLRWLPVLVERMLLHFGDRSVAPSSRSVEAFLLSDEQLGGYLSQRRTAPVVDVAAIARPMMLPATSAIAEWELPSITTVGELAGWFALTPDELEWLADQHGFETCKRIQAACNYRYRWIFKRGGRTRLFEIPKPRLKQLQRQLLTDVLDRVPPHPASHAFRQGRSIGTCLTPHVGQEIVLHYDLREFFPSIRGSRVFGVFRTLGYPESVARQLTGICTNRTLSHVRRQLCSQANCVDAAAIDLLYRSPHLPQGAPTSPAIANLIAYRLDCRLHGLAQSMGAVYTRYADDLIFSGGMELRSNLRRFGTFVLAIVIDEGFHIRHRKTRIMPRGGRQQVAGVVLNQKLNAPRREYDNLRALLFNCIREGPQTQNRSEHEDFRAHLLGRIGWVAMGNPCRKETLMNLFGQISWSSNEAAD